MSYSNPGPYMIQQVKIIARNERYRPSSQHLSTIAAGRTSGGNEVMFSYIRQMAVWQMPGRWCPSENTCAGKFQIDIRFTFSAYRMKAMKSTLSKRPCIQWLQFHFHPRACACALRYNIYKFANTVTCRWPLLSSGGRYASLHLFDSLITFVQSLW